MREKYIRAIRELLSDMSDRDVRFIYAVVQLVFMQSNKD